MMWLGGNRYGMALITKNAPLRQTRASARNPLWNYYKCKDDRWIAFSMNQTDRYLPFFCKAIGKPHFAEDERFNNQAALLEHSKELIEILDDVFVTKTQSEWVKVLSEAEGTIWERVQDVFDLPDDPQVIANNYIVDFDHPLLGPSKWLQTPVTYSSMPLSTRKMAPALGEDTTDVLIDTLGYTRDDVAILREEGAIL
jgi:crotonobetainyl-CoA:carnitine CoA-transferase CaiB-like acyl-CoA transferase